MPLKKQRDKIGPILKFGPIYGATDAEQQPTNQPTTIVIFGASGDLHG
jgi:hypothetical protein